MPRPPVPVPHAALPPLPGFATSVAVQRSAASVPRGVVAVSQHVAPPAHPSGSPAESSSSVARGGVPRDARFIFARGVPTHDARPVVSASAGTSGVHATGAAQCQPLRVEAVVDVEDAEDAEEQGSEVVRGTIRGGVATAEPESASVVEAEDGRQKPTKDLTRGSADMVVMTAVDRVSFAAVRNVDTRSKRVRVGYHWITLGPGETVML